MPEASMFSSPFRFMPILAISPSSIRMSLCWYLPRMKAAPFLIAMLMNQMVTGKD